ncbi:MAG: hypothetical protein M1825_000345 [Sarcosagium campestre]|nr:MAG: hypothetical protein M1825_000345 [Sarcosagium campestre]
MELDEVIIERDPESSRDISRRLVAAVLSQIFSYMVHAGLRYGYVLAFTLRALQAPPRGPLWRQQAAAKLPRWEVVLEDLIDALPTCKTPSSVYKPSRPPKDFRSSPVRLRPRPRPGPASTCRDSQDGNGSDDHDPDTPSRPPRVQDVPAPHPHPSARTSSVKGSSTGQERRDTGQRRQFCSHRCLRGLVTGDRLDSTCPNMALHGRDRHPIDRQSFVRLLQTQLALDLDHDMVNLGIWGSRGALFQVTLREYGYTFIGKATPAHHVRHLQTEARIYERLESIQGIHVPVYVGSIDLEWHYPYEGVVDLVHMICLSFAGQPIRKCTNGNNRAQLVQQARNAMQAIHELGVLHRDAEPRNLLWDATAGQVMVVDFERAETVQTRPVLAELSPNRKRKYEEEGHDVMGKGVFVFINELDEMTMQLQ